MLIAFDIGNTQITIGLYENKKLHFISRIATNVSHTRDQYAIEIKNILQLYDFEKSQVTDAIISSVVPTVLKNIQSAVEKLFGIMPLIVGPGIKTGLKIKVDNPNEVGADLVIGAVAAIDSYDLPAIIFDFGTATKVSVVDKNGSFLGCAITAGINMSLEALASKTASLPSIKIAIPKSAIGTNTIESMKAGLVFSSAAIIDFMAERIESELGTSATLILTGGMSSLLVGQSKREVIFCDNLLLEGLRIVFEKNQHRIP